MLCGVMAGVLTAGPALAQQRDTTRADSTVYRIDDVIVNVRPVALTDGASALTVQLDSLSIQTSPTLEDVLRAMPLVQVRKNSRGESHFALRGAGERQVAVLVDGVPVTLGWDHRTDLSVVPMMAARDIQLARGLPSVLAGPNVLGGVVEVSVARGAGPIERPRPFELSAGVDHVGTRALSAVLARRFEPDAGDLLVRGGAGYRSSPGHALASGLSESGPADGSAAANNDDLRLNSDDEQVDGFLAMRYHGAGGSWLSFSASGFHAERGVPPEQHEAEPRRWRYPSVGQLFAATSGGTGQRETPFGMGDLEASLGLEIGRTEIDAYAQDDAYDVITGGETGEERTLTLRLLGDHTLGQNGELRAAATFADIAHDEVVRPTLDETLAAQYQQRLWSVGGEVGWRLGEVPLTGGLLSGARVSGGLVLEGAFTPRTGGNEERPPIRAGGGRLGVTALAGESVRLHAGVSRRARFPSLRELYSAALGRFEPNPELGAETLTATEVGATAQLGPAELEAVLFHHRMSDAIVRTTSEVARFKRVNRDKVRSTGVELLGGFGWGDVAVTGDLTLQRVRVTDPTASGEAASRAEYQPSVAGGLDLTALLPFDLRGSTGVRYVGRQRCVVPGQDDAGMALDPSGRLDARLARTFRWASGVFSAIDATLSLDNATGKAIYDQCGLPQPGRTLHFQLRLRG